MIERGTLVNPFTRFGRRVSQRRGRFTRRERRMMSGLGAIILKPGEKPPAGYALTPRAIVSGQYYGRPGKKPSAIGRALKAVAEAGRVIVPVGQAFVFGAAAKALAPVIARRFKRAPAPAATPTGPSTPEESVWDMAKKYTTLPYFPGGGGTPGSAPGAPTSTAGPAPTDFGVPSGGGGGGGGGEFPMSPTEAGVAPAGNPIPFILAGLVGMLALSGGKKRR